MRPKNRLVAKERKYYRPEIQYCPHCQTKLAYCHSVSNKLVVTLKGVFQIINMWYRCPNPDCSSRTVYRTAEAERFSMKHTTYGMDVIAWVGQLRFQEHKTRSEIAELLRERGIPTSERNVQMLYERYTLLLRASAESHAKEVLQQVTREHGGIILSIDGVQPEKGNETLISCVKC